MLFFASQGSNEGYDVVGVNTISNRGFESLLLTIVWGVHIIGKNNNLKCSLLQGLQQQ
jgi:hypothetical protein